MMTAYGVPRPYDRRTPPAAMSRDVTARVAAPSSACPRISGQRTAKSDDSKWIGERVQTTCCQPHHRRAHARVTHVGRWSASG